MHSDVPNGQLEAFPSISSTLTHRVPNDLSSTLSTFRSLWIGGSPPSSAGSQSSSRRSPLLGFEKNTRT